MCIICHELSTSCAEKHCQHCMKDKDNPHWSQARSLCCYSPEHVSHAKRTVGVHCWNGNPLKPIGPFIHTLLRQYCYASFKPAVRLCNKPVILYRQPAGQVLLVAGIFRWQSRCRNEEAESRRGSRHRAPLHHCLRPHVRAAAEDHDPQRPAQHQVRFLLPYETKHHQSWRFWSTVYAGAQA